MRPCARPSGPPGTLAPLVLALLVLGTLFVLPLPLSAQPGAWLGSWEELGPPGAVVTRVVPHPTDPDLLYARTREAVLRSGDGGASWQEITPALALAPQGELAIDPYDPEVLFTGGAPPFPLLRSTDGGESWAPAGAGLPCCAPCCSTVTRIRFAPSDPGVVYASHPNVTVFKSTDGGGRFHAVGPGLPPDGNHGVIALDPSDPLVLYTARLLPRSPGFGSPWRHQIFRSPDGGASWAALGTITSGRVGFHGIAVDPQDPDLLFLHLDDGLWRSRDGGGSWSFLAPPPGSVGTLSAFAVDPGDPGLVYAGTPEGAIFLSPNGGESWLPLGADHPAGQILTLAVSPSSRGTLYAGAFEGGVSTLAPDRTAPCVPDEATLCLLGGRFRAEVLWQHTRGRGGSGRADPLGDRAGTYRFFEEERPDLFVKLLDGRRVNGRFWVFIGGLTHVRHQLFVSDSGSGRLRVFPHPGGGFASTGDVGAFPGGGEAEGVPSSEADAGASTASTALPFAGGRFEVELTWRRPGGALRPARGAVLPGGEAGYFWFSHPDNPELVVKLVDARSLVDAFWLFHAGLSNLEYTLSITDTVTGTTETFEHPEGGFASGTLILPD